MKRYQATRTGRAGTATVEMAIVAPLFIFLLFAILEMGLVIKDYLGLNQAAREAARSASLGSTVATINTRMRASAPTIDTTLITWRGDWRQYHPATGTWDNAWTPLADVGSGADIRNNAPVDAQIRITVTYPHRMVTGRSFSYLADAGNPDIMTLSSNMVMRRE